MRILVVGKLYSEGFALHIKECLESLQHDVECFEPGLNTGRLPGRLGTRIDQVRSLVYEASDNVARIRMRRFQKLLRLVKNHNFDLVLCCFDFLWPDEVAQLKEHVGAVSMWFPDHLANFGRAYFMNAPYDALFFKDPHIVRMLNGVIESPVYYLPECFSVTQHTLPFETEIPSQYHCDITTAGNQHSYRVAILKHLTEYDVFLWGNAAPLWMRAPQLKSMYRGRPVRNHEKVLAFRGAKIVLNSLHFGEIDGVNVRTFEAAGAGSFQLVDWKPGLQQLFKLGEEIVAFRGLDDLKKLIRYYLPKEEERLLIARAAHRRAMQDHKYEDRLSMLIDTVVDKATGFPLPHPVPAN